MKILMLSFDAGMLADGEDRSGDTRARHRLYATYLRKTYPEGQITVLVRADAQTPTTKQSLGDGLELHPIPGPRALFALRALRLARQLMRSTRFDLVATQTPFDDGFAGWLLKRRYHLPLHVQMNSSFLDMAPWIKERPLLYRLFNALGKFVAQRADSIRVVCQGEQARLERLFPRLSSKIVALHPYINEEFFGTIVASSPTERPVVLFVGRLVEQKNLPTLLRAFAELQIRGQDFQAVLVGDGPQKANLFALARHLGLESSIEWCGEMTHEETKRWFARAHLSVLPSYHEGFGRVVAESYLQGTPVIATPFVSAGELILDKKTGFVLDGFADPQEFALRMEELLRSPTLTQIMGEAGKRHLEEYLKFGEEYLKLLVQIWEATVEGKGIEALPFQKP